MRRHEGRRRGSALILALVAILILTVLGIGVAYLTTIEDRISGNDKASKIGFYAADAGLRNGERLLASFVAGGGNLDTLFTVTTTYSPPGGGWTAYLLRISSTDIVDQVIQSVGSDPSGRGVYTLYVRNNEDDLGGTATHDIDKKINLIAVGEYVVVDSGGSIVGRGIQKVLEEQINLTKAGAMVNTQKGVNPAGTGSGTF